MSADKTGRTALAAYPPSSGRRNRLEWRVVGVAVGDLDRMVRHVLSFCGEVDT